MDQVDQHVDVNGQAFIISANKTVIPIVKQKWGLTSTNRKLRGRGPCHVRRVSEAIRVSEPSYPYHIAYALAHIAYHIAYPQVHIAYHIGYPQPI